MTMLKRLVKVSGELKPGLKRKFEYLSHVVQGLIFITIIDEFCYVKLTNKRGFIRLIISRKRYLKKNLS